jgi:hypothetical protein
VIARATLLGLALLTACGTVARPAPAAIPAASPALARRGFALAVWDVRAPDLVPASARALDELAALGVNAVLLPVLWRQHDRRSATVAADPAFTLADADVVAISRAARQRGIAVALLPIVDLEVIERGAWRGTLAPPDLERWWQSYRACLLHLADVAAIAGVELLAVGSELGSLEDQQERWWALIGEVRRHYHGALTYSANWDHYTRVTFWDRLDAVGISAYPPLSQAGEPSDLPALTRAWRRDARAMLAWAARQRRPLILTEVGYPARASAARAPWDYTAEGPPDPALQTRCYAAFARAWAGQPGLHGVYFWIWEAGSSYRPGAATRAILRAYFGLTR